MPIQESSVWSSSSKASESGSFGGSRTIHDARAKLSHIRSALSSAWMILAGSSMSSGVKSASCSHPQKARRLGTKARQSISWRHRRNFDHEPLRNAAPCSNSTLRELRMIPPIGIVPYPRAAFSSLGWSRYICQQISTGWDQRHANFVNDCGQ